MNLQIPDYRNAVIVAKSPSSAKRYFLFTRSTYESVPSCRAVTHYIIVLTNMLIMNLCSSL